MAAQRTAQQVPIVSPIIVGRPPNIPGGTVSTEAAWREWAYGAATQILGGQCSERHRSHVISADACLLLDEQRKNKCSRRGFPVFAE
jgi:hypothetical protein